RTSSVYSYNESLHSSPYFISVKTTTLTYGNSNHQKLHTFPTRRSSDLDGDNNRRKQVDVLLNDMEEKELRAAFSTEQSRSHRRQDRKSTRLNSSHVSSSYAVFCLKKKYLRQVIFIISIPPIHSIL